MATAASSRFGFQPIRLGCGPQIELRPVDDFEIAVEVLAGSGAAFDPIAAIDVAKAEIVVRSGVMDVTADHAAAGRSTSRHCPAVQPICIEKSQTFPTRNNRMPVIIVSTQFAL
jgi:hypothetical protein